MKKSIDTSVFYGDECNPNSLKISVENIYKVFSRQILAFEYYDSIDFQVILNQRIKIFSFESKHNGKRKFLVSSWTFFFQKYFENDDSNSRKNYNHGHYYEIIRENFPCRAYFDLEFSKLHNSQLDGDHLTSKWVQIVSDKLKETFNIEVTADNAVVLDSSTNEKYSKHLTFCILKSDNQDDSNQREVFFHNNFAVGHVIDQIMNDITIRAGVANDPIPKSEFEELWVNNKDGKKIFFVDLGVYSRNRAFRIYGCSKYGKNVTLKLLPLDQRKYRGLAGLSKLTKEQMFQSVLEKSFVVPFEVLEFINQDSIKNSRIKCRADTEMIDLIDYGAPGSIQIERLLRIVNLNSSDKIPFGSESSSYSLSETFSNSNDISENISQKTSSQFSQSSVVSYRPYNLNPNKTKEWEDRIIAKSTYSNRNISFFPPLDQFVLDCVNNTGIPGQLNGWTLYLISPLSSTLSISSNYHNDENKSENINRVASGNQSNHNQNQPNRYKMRYQIANNRYCHNIGRPHKSNGIMMEIDFTRGWITQICWDPDCRGYRSPPILIPSVCLPSQALIEDFHVDQDIMHILLTDPSFFP
jgi:hypothetical protein